LGPPTPKGPTRLSRGFRGTPPKGRLREGRGGHIAGEFTAVTRVRVDSIEKTQPTLFVLPALMLRCLWRQKVCRFRGKTKGFSLQPVIKIARYRAKHSQPSKSDSKSPGAHPRASPRTNCQGPLRRFTGYQAGNDFGWLGYGGRLRRLRLNPIYDCVKNAKPTKVQGGRCLFAGRGSNV